METLMNMPIQDRKYYIMKHNADEEELKASVEGGGDVHEIGGEAINTYARLSQTDPLR